MTQEDLNCILSQHKIWLESNGDKGEQANFSRQYLESNVAKPTKGFYRITFHENGDLSAMSGTMRNCNPTQFEIENERISYFTGLDFSGANLTRAIFNDAVFYDCNMNGINLSNCDLSNAKFGKVLLKQAYFGGYLLLNRGITATHSKLSGAYFVQCELNHCSLQEANFTNSILTLSSFEESDILSSNFSGACLNQVFFRNANLRQTKFISCNLEEANFEFADLTSADISLANVHLANFSNAKIDGLTCKMKSFSERLKDSFSSDNSKRHFLGCRIESSYGNERVKKAIKEESFIEEFSLTHSNLYKLWLVSSDCGRSIMLWLLWSILTVNVFACVYLNLEPNGFHFIEELVPLNKEGSYFLYFYYSIVTFTTLGFGDITPITKWAMFIVILEVTLGFVMLGLLISILANKVASRS